MGADGGGGREAGRGDGEARHRGGGGATHALRRGHGPRRIDRALGRVAATPRDPRAGADRLPERRLRAPVRRLRDACGRGRRAADARTHGGHRGGGPASLQAHGIQGRVRGRAASPRRGRRRPARLAVRRADPRPLASPPTASARARAQEEAQARRLVRPGLQGAPRTPRIAGYGLRRLRLCVGAPARARADRRIPATRRDRARSARAGDARSSGGDRGAARRDPRLRAGEDRQRGPLPGQGDATRIRDDLTRSDDRGHSTVRMLLVGAAMLLLGGCASTVADTAAEKKPLSAEASLKDKDGKNVGRATLIETSEGVRIALTGYRLPPGTHGLHIHTVGSCQPPEFTSAGAHFNPANKKHGRMNPEGPHAGDLPNLVVAASGEGGLDVTTKAVTLGPGPTSLLGPEGTSIVVHVAADDEKTDPVGNSGGRIACGVIVR